MKAKKIEKIELEMSFNEFSLMTIAVNMFSDLNLNAVVISKFKESGQSYMGFELGETLMVDALSNKLLTLYKEMDMSLPSDD